MNEPLWVGEIRAALSGVRPSTGPLTVGRLVVGFEEVTSTNDVLRELAAGGYPEGTVVVARRQSGGRGRLGRRWASPEGGIWMSVLVRPEVICPASSGLWLAVASVACCHALEQVVGLKVGIKWPNDVYLQGKKLGGISAESGRGGIVLGIGLNAAFSARVLPPEVREGAITVLDAVGQAPWIPLVAAVILHVDHFYRLVREAGFPPLLRLWRERATVLGRDVCIMSGNACWVGRAEDIDEEGALLVRRPGGELERVTAGDVSLRG